MVFCRRARRPGAGPASVHRVRPDSERPSGGSVRPATASVRRLRFRPATFPSGPVCTMPLDTNMCSDLQSAPTYVRDKGERRDWSDGTTGAGASLHPRVHARERLSAHGARDRQPARAVIAFHGARAPRQPRTARLHPSRPQQAAGARARRRAAAAQAATPRRPGRRRHAHPRRAEHRRLRRGAVAAAPQRRRLPAARRRRLHDRRRHPQRRPHRRASPGDRRQRRHRRGAGRRRGHHQALLPRSGPHPCLQPANELYEPIVLDDVELVGKVVGVLRRL